MNIVRKYQLSHITYEEIQWVMTTFDRRCDIQCVPKYAQVNTIFTKFPPQLVTDNSIYVIVQNDDDNLFFTIKFPSALLIDSTLVA